LNELLTKALSSVAVAGVLAVAGWSYSLNDRLARMEEKQQAAEGTLAVVQQHEASIRVIESRLGYIEQGVTRIETVLVRLADK
jgi:hypothetical protein|tara:strand:+ start:875 stop:1123 length:249 start_codon:yes stop_codon:yes gene_type:complete